MKQLISLDYDEVNGYEDYAYPYGHIKSVESKLITRKHMLEFASVDNLDDLFKGLEDTDYWPYISKAGTLTEQELAIEKYMNNVFNDIIELIPPEKKWIVKLIRVRYDINNFRMLFKSKISGKNDEPSFSVLGNVPMIKYDNAWQRDVTHFNDVFENEYKVVVDQIIKDYGNGVKGQAFDSKLTQHFFDYIFSIIPKGIEGDFFRNYFTIRIDLTNLITFLRIKHNAPDKFSKCYVKGGLLTEPQIVNMELGSTPYSQLLHCVDNKCEVLNPLTHLERSSRKYLMEYTATQSLNKPLDAVTVINYILNKEVEAKNIRLILSLKTKTVPKQVIQKLIGDEYA